jgi:hypothetical protein
MDSKTCSKCKETKSLTEFHKDKKRLDGLHRQCVVCRNETASRYRILNSESIKSKRKVYDSKNKERKKLYDMNYLILNRTRIMGRKSEYEKKKRNTDILFAMACRLRNAITKSLKYNGYSKKSRTHEILGCSYEEFKSHIENQFMEGMSWDNRSEWHLDHITPVSWGQTEEEIIALNHYTNLKPLWAEDNLSKGNRRSDHQ